jgi:hypothetical protein
VGDWKKKMTQGWVVYGGMRHAEPQREMFPRSGRLADSANLQNRSMGPPYSSKSKTALLEIPYGLLYVKYGLLSKEL